MNQTSPSELSNIYNPLIMTSEILGNKLEADSLAHVRSTDWPKRTEQDHTASHTTNWI